MIKENIQNKNLNKNLSSYKTILIKGIPSDSTKKDLINYFQKYGEIENVIINTDNQNINLKGNINFLIFSKF